MALRLSTGFQKKFLEQAGLPTGIVIGTGLTFVDGGTGNDSITRTTGSFITDGFQVGDWIQVFGATTGGNNFSAKLLSVAALTLEVATGKVANGEAGVAGTAVVCAKGASFNDLFKFGFMKIFSGTQPASADAAESGTELVKITDDGGTHNTSTGENGLQFEDAIVDGVLNKLSTQTWKGSPSNSGTAGWFRFYAQEGVTGSSTTAVRFDGAIALTGAELNLASLAIATGTDVLINQFDVMVSS